MSPPCWGVHYRLCINQLRLAVLFWNLVNKLMDPFWGKTKKYRYLRWTEVVQNLCNINLTQNNGVGEWMKGHWCKVHYRLSMNQLRLSVLLWKSSQRKRLLWPFTRLKMENKDVFGELRMWGKTTMCNLICIYSPLDKSIGSVKRDRNPSAWLWSFLLTLRATSGFIIINKIWLNETIKIILSQ